MTERLYYTNSYDTEFTATVTAVGAVDDRPSIVLNQTLFYPTSGGQPYDTGIIDDWPIVDVVAQNGDIHHVLEQPVGRTIEGLTVRGQIDWTRRYDHMQQHSGQHLLSQVFYQLFGYETVSVHFGADYSTLDLDVAEMTRSQLDAVEQKAMDLVYANLPISAYFVTEDEVAKLPLRRPPVVSGKIRIVEIAKYDYSACGGTHCRTTAEVGPIKLIRQERRRSQTRLTFLCGRRAYADYAAKHTLILDAAAHFSTDTGQVPELIARSLEQIKTLERTAADLAEQLMVYEARTLVEEAEPVGDSKVVIQWFDNRAPGAVKTLANQLQLNPGTVALLGCAEGEKATVIFARGDEVVLHMGNMLRSALAEFGGGGGGRPEFAQGGGIDPADGPALLAYAKSLLV